MITQYRKPLLFAATLLLPLLFAACSNNSSTNVNTESGNPQALRVFWWGNEGRQERTVKVIQQFEEAHPDIQIEWQDAPNAQYWIDIAMHTADQNMPDVIQMDYKYIKEFAQRKLLLPLNPLVQEGSLNIADLDASSVESGTVEEQLYGIVTGINAPSLLYDPELFDTYQVAVPPAGYTYEDLLETTRKLKAAVNQEDFFPIGNTIFDFGYYLRQRGAALYHPSGTALGYDDDHYLMDFLQLQQQFLDEGLMAPKWRQPTSNAEKDSLIIQGQAALHSLTSNNVIGFTQAAGRPLKLLPLPSYGGGQEGNYVKPSMFFSISSYTEQAENAAKFIDFFLNDLQANEELRGERGVPAVSAVRNHLTADMSEDEKEQYTFMDNVQQHSSPIDPPAPLASGRIDTMFRKIEAEFMNDKLTAADAAAEFRRNAGDIFASQTTAQ